MHTVHTVDAARRLADTFLDGEPDPLRDRQRDNVRALFGIGGSVERILTTLREEIARERGTANDDPTA